METKIAPEGGLQGAPHAPDDDVDHMFAGGTPRGRYDEAKQQFPLITKPRLSDPIGLGQGLASCQSTLTLVD